MTVTFGFVPGTDLGLRTTTNRREVCGRQYRSRACSRFVIRMVVEPSKKDSVTAPPEKEVGMKVEGVESRVNEVE